MVSFFVVFGPHFAMKIELIALEFPFSRSLGFYNLGKVQRSKVLQTKNVKLTIPVKAIRLSNEKVLRKGKINC